MASTRNVVTMPYVDDVKSLLNGPLGIKGQTSINLCRNTTWHDLQDLLAELNQQTVERGIDLLLLGASLLLAILNGNVHQPGIFGLL